MKIKSLYTMLLVFAVVFTGCNSKNAEPNKNIEDEEPVLNEKRTDIKNRMDKVAQWQMDNLNYSTTSNLHDQGIASWTNATFYVGLNEWAATSNADASFFDWLDGIGETTNWMVPSNFKNHSGYQLYHADEFCIGQMYLAAYERHDDQEMLEDVRERADWVLKNPADPNMNHRNKQSWTWCDALFMAPPVYAQLAAIENESKYLEFMDKEFKRTYDHLYSKEDKLFFRDDSYFGKQEKNNEKVFWGRGNGWVAAGLVNILKQLPKDSEYRPFYENLFKEFVPRLVALQSDSGFWHASLLDPQSYPAPEASVTALITYAVAYGINENLLESSTYLPVANKSWESLMSIINEDGKLGWVQPIGADPKAVTSDMTAPYGVGALLMAGSEMYKMETE